VQNVAVPLQVEHCEEEQAEQVVVLDWYEPAGHTDMHWFWYSKRPLVQAVHAEADPEQVVQGGWQVEHCDVLLLKDPAGHVA